MTEGFPIRRNKQDILITPEDYPEEYAAMLAERQAAAAAETERAATDTQQRTRRQQFVAGMTALKTDYAKLDDETQAVSQLEFRRMLKRVNRGVTWLGEILQDLKMVEKE